MPAGGATSHATVDSAVRRGRRLTPGPPSTRVPNRSGAGATTPFFVVSASAPRVILVDIREELRQLAAPLAEEAGYELVDVELGAQGHHRIVRVLLDKPGGIT